MKKLFALIIIGLLIGIFYQAAYLFGEYGPDMLAIWSTLGKSGQWRGANFNQSQKVADYIEFLNGNIPENSRVILPSFGSNSKVVINPYMQFFLAPREVLNCGDLDCLQSIFREDSYIVVVGNLPEELFQDESYLKFDASWGLLTADNFIADIHPQLVSFSNLEKIILAGFVPLLWLIALTLSGTTFLRMLLPGEKWILQIAFGYGLGLSIFSIGIATINLMGLPLNSTQILIVTGIILVSAIFIWFFDKQKKETPSNSKDGIHLRNKFDVWLLMFLGLGVITSFLAVGKGYHRIDAIQIWGAKGYGIAADRSLGTVTNWGTNTLAYPLHIPIMIAAFRVLFGDVLPSSKLIFSSYFMASIFICYYALLGMGVKRWLSGMAVLLIITTPVLFRHGTIGYANLPLAYYLLSGVYSYGLVYGGTPSHKKILLSGLFFAFAAWTRPEGLMLAFSSVSLLLLITFLKKRNVVTWRYVSLFIIPLMLYILFWQVIKWQIYPDPLSKTNLTTDALTNILQGDLHIQELFFIFSFFLRELISFKAWGAFGVILVFVSIFVLVFHKYVTPNVLLMISMGGLFLLLVVGMYYLTSFDTVNDLGWWVTSGLDRMVFPGLIIFWLGIIGALNGILEGFGASK